MSYTTTTKLGLKKAVIGSNQAFETAAFNLNWDAVDAEAVAIDGRLDVVEPIVTGHTSTLASQATTLSNHATTLADHETRIDSLEGGTSGFVTADNVMTLSNKTLVSPREITTVSATAATGTINFDAATQADLYYTTNASANFTLNFRGNSTTTLSSLLAVGSSISLVFRNTNGTTAYYPSLIRIDGTTVTPKWQGGSAPSAGNASSVDVYSFVITKTAATPTYVVLASQVKFA